MLRHRYTAALVALTTLGSFSLARGQAPQETGGAKQVVNALGMKLALIPAGEFRMGSPDGEGSIIELPQHRVRITRPFYLGVCPVTQAEYEQVLRINPSYFSAAGHGKAKVVGLDTSRFPVETVSWDDAVEFCRKLSALPEERAAGRVYRLPTEAQWEYACRAGTTTPFSFGKTANGTQANCNGNYTYGTHEIGPYLGRTTTVGSYPPNAFGLYDMHGNVWEWCADLYDAGYYANSPIDDPAGPATGFGRVYRGGSWSINAGSCRAANRDYYTPSYRSFDLGFRVCLAPAAGQGP